MATYARCGWMFNNHFTSNLLKNLWVKKIWKSIKIWQNCGHEFAYRFLGPPCTMRPSNLECEIFVCKGGVPLEQVSYCPIQRTPSHVSRQWWLEKLHPIHTPSLSRRTQPYLGGSGSRHPIAAFNHTDTMPYRNELLIPSWLLLTAYYALAVGGEALSDTAICPSVCPTAQLP